MVDKRRISSLDIEFAKVMCWECREFVSNGDVHLCGRVRMKISVQTALSPFDDPAFMLLHAWW